MLGGLYKKSTYLEQYQKEHGDIVIVDSGDFLNEDLKIKESVLPSSKLKADLTAQIYKMTGIDEETIERLSEEIPAITTAKAKSLSKYITGQIEKIISNRIG